jgi:hypothetical protein
MHEGRLIFAQLMDFFPRHEFNQCVRRYQGNHRMRQFSCLDQFLAMAFAQLTGRESLRDIENCLRAMGGKLYHAGFRGPVARSTLADANESRDWRIYADFAYGLIATARKLYAHDEFALELDNTVYALDASLIDLCLSLFPWAKFRKGKGAVKLHTLLDLRGSIPSFVVVTHGLVHDVNILDQIAFEPAAFYVMDRAYLDLRRLYAIHQARAFFVTRAKKRFDFRRRYSHPVDRTTGVQCDQTIVPANFYPRKRYPEPLRRIRYWDAQKDKRLVFLTNNFTLPAPTIAQLYQCRWHVELFFKWIKQHLRIKAFYGTSPTAVYTQIWIAISVYVLVAIVKKQLGLALSTYTILQILSVTLFEKMPILRAFSGIDYKNQEDDLFNQLNLFNS